MHTSLLGHAPIVGLAVLMGAPVGAQPQPLLCSVLGPAARFKAVATGRLKTKRTHGYHRNEIGYPIFDTDPPGEVCARQIDAGTHGFWADDVVATRDENIAISFGVVLGRRPGDYAPYLGCLGDYPCNAHRIFGNVVTGGGRVAAFHDLLPRLYYGTIDTSGAHHLVSECQAAMAQLDVASTALAQGLLPGEPPEAARAIVDLGSVRIARDEEVVLAPRGPGVTIYQVRDLIIEHGEAYGYPGGFVGEGGFLFMDGCEEDTVVLNVSGRLRLGRGGIISCFCSEGNLINVVGTGPNVVMRKWSLSNASILAPQRRIRMLAWGGGGLSELYAGQAPALFGRDITLVGSTDIGYGGYLPSYCGFPDD